jgi:hypothetical protein
VSFFQDVSENSISVSDIVLMPAGQWHDIGRLLTCNLVWYTFSFSKCIQPPIPVGLNMDIAILTHSSL